MSMIRYTGLRVGDENYDDYACKIKYVHFPTAEQPYWIIIFENGSSITTTAEVTLFTKLEQGGDK